MIMEAKTLAVLIDPNEDGVKHINIWSRGRTPLGRWLSNFTLSPFQLDGRMFASVEAYWYWLATGQQHEHLCGLYDFSAKTAGMKLPRVELEPTYFQSKIAQAFVAKLRDHLIPTADLLYSTLPFKHYFTYGQAHGAPARVIDQTGKHYWQMRLWSDLRIYLRAAVMERQIPVGLSLDTPTRELLNTVDLDELAKCVEAHPAHHQTFVINDSWSVWNPA